MVKLDNCIKYELDFSKPTRSNSVVIGDRVIMIMKRDELGKTIKFFIAYDYKTKRILAWNNDKDKLIKFLVDRESDIRVTFGERGLFDER